MYVFEILLLYVSNLEQFFSLHTPQKILLCTLIVPWSFGTYEILQFFPSKNAQIKEQRSTSWYIFSF